jgi:hypothetical protein
MPIFEIPDQSPGGIDLDFNGRSIRVPITREIVDYLQNIVNEAREILESQRIEHLKLAATTKRKLNKEEFDYIVKEHSDDNDFFYVGYLPDYLFMRLIVGGVEVENVVCAHLRQGWYYTEDPNGEIGDVLFFSAYGEEMVIEHSASAAGILSSAKSHFAW